MSTRSELENILVNYLPSAQYKDAVKLLDDVDIENATRMEALEKPRTDSEYAYFVTSKETLSQDQYDRVKAQIDEFWPKNLPRPILLEACEVVKL